MFFVMAKEMTFWIVLPSVGERGTIPHIFEPGDFHYKGKTKMQAQGWQGRHRRRVILNTSEDSSKSPQGKTKMRAQGWQGRHRRRVILNTSEDSSKSPQGKTKMRAQGWQGRHRRRVILNTSEDSSKSPQVEDAVNPVKTVRCKPAKMRPYSEERESRFRDQRSRARTSSYPSVFSCSATKSVEYQTDNSDEESTKEFALNRKSRYDMWMDGQNLMPDVENKDFGEVENSMNPVKTVHCKPANRRLYADEEDARLRDQRLHGHKLSYPSVFSRLGTKFTEDEECQIDISDEESADEFTLNQRFLCERWISAQNFMPDVKKRSGEEDSVIPVKRVPCKQSEDAAVCR
ncbi:uncharacterized protein LOC118197781 isoform X4 [Stegodyphus dumicola]|uniref:uncharacterized protein LOC118197781 isoform X4 n=1 Tax=Stegodyphus dumicola TaxID=202533 RepID=UPI0015AC4DF8|nr:uncharacterized protein LOC118197781 isoform X4 [Stegodyphus dumicola]